MTRKWAGGLLLILLSSMISILWSSSLERTAPGAMLDFKPIYYGVRCLFQQVDPYDGSAALNVYSAESRERQSNQSVTRPNIEQNIQLPTAFTMLSPIALLPFGFAQVLWTIVTALGLTWSACLMWDLARNNAPNVSLLLTCIFLGNCETLIEVGNSAGIVVSFCAIAVWCFLKSRYVLAGVLLLGVSLALKPTMPGWSGCTFCWQGEFIASGPCRLCWWLLR